MSGEDILAAVAIGFAVLTLAVLSALILGSVTNLINTFFNNGDCTHDWEQWGDPIKNPDALREMQSRICKKCRMIERRVI